MALAGSKVPLVWANLLHNRVRTMVGIIGIMVAVVLIFMQLGFLGSAEANATLLYDKLDFDLLLLSPNYVRFSEPGWFPLSRLHQVRGHPDVAHVCGLWSTYQYWRKDEGTPASSVTLAKRRILVLAFSPSENVFHLRDVKAQQESLTLPGKVLFDKRSRPEFQVPRPGVRPNELADQTYWLGATPVQVAGQFSLGAGFICDGMVLAGESTYLEIEGVGGLDPVNFGLIKLHDNETPPDPLAVADQLNRSLGPGADVHVWTRGQIEASERRYWVRSTSIGIIFFCGVLVAVLVGVVFVYQVISSDIGNRLKEFATLKAMGYSSGYLSWTILHQSILLALFGFVPGCVIAFVLYAMAALFAGIPIGIPGERTGVVLLRCLIVLAITVGLCACRGCSP